MSIETTFTSIAQSLSRIADALERNTPVHDTRLVAADASAQVVPVPAPVVTPVAAPAPVVPVAVTPVAAPAPAPVVAPVPVPTPIAAMASPFGKDEQGNDMTLLNYVMATYRALGPIKGAQIQTILTGMNYANINEVRPEHYTAFYNAVEALKVA